MDAALLRQLLESDTPRKEIARRVGVSASTVSRYAARLGFPRQARPCRYEWRAIRSYYEEGHTVRSCMARFGFTAGAWHAAVTRGDVVPRWNPPQHHANVMRRRVERLLADGLNQAEIGRRLGLTPGTVSYHARRLGLPRAEKFARRHDWAAIQRYHDVGYSVRECQAEFGFSSASWHDAVRRGDLSPRPAAMPLEDLLVPNRRRGRFNIKVRLVSAGLKDGSCEECGVDSWQGAPLALALHHANGDRNDNRLENLRLLCPNCHSQTANFAGRNRTRARAP